MIHLLKRQENWEVILLQPAIIAEKVRLKIRKAIIYRLLAGIDENKDQSYFLCQVSQEQLAYALFPIGDLKKPEVRKIASKGQAVV